jgi:hypothetical protein
MVLREPLNHDPTSVLREGECGGFGKLYEPNRSVVVLVEIAR